MIDTHKHILENFDDVYSLNKELNTLWQAMLS